MCGTPFTICLLIWVAKLETVSHVLQGDKTKLKGFFVITCQCQFPELRFFAKKFGAYLILYRKII